MDIHNLVMTPVSSVKEETTSDFGDGANRETKEQISLGLHFSRLDQRANQLLPLLVVPVKEEREEVNSTLGSTTELNPNIIIKEESFICDERSQESERDNSDNDEVKNETRVKEEPEEVSSTLESGTELNPNIVIKEESFICDLRSQESEGGSSDNDEVKNEARISEENELLYKGITSSHEVYVKEEIPYDDSDQCKYNPINTSSCDIYENASFGAHFLASGQESKYQYTNGQSAEMERCQSSDGLLGYASPGGAVLEHFSKEDFEKTNFCYTQYTMGSTGANYPVINARKRFPCRFCHFQTNCKFSLQGHVIRKHRSPDFDPIDCPYCKFRSLSLMETEDHIAKRHHKEKKYFSCSYTNCEFEARSVGNLRYHIAAKHTMEKNYFCHLCPYKCILPHNMRSHLLKIHNKIRSLNTIRHNNYLPCSSQ